MRNYPLFIVERIDTVKRSPLQRALVAAEDAMAATDLALEAWCLPPSRKGTHTYSVSLRSCYIAPAVIMTETVESRNSKLESD